MYIYHALINVLSAHMMHINQNTISVSFRYVTCLCLIYFPIGFGCNSN